MELNLTIGHIGSAIFMAYMLSMFLQGALLLRAIAWVFLWQLLTPTNDVWYQDLLMCFGLFLAVELINFSVKSATAMK